MKAKVKLFEYLEQNLNFGSVDSVVYNISSQNFHVVLYPFKKFFNKDLSIIRDVLESDFVRDLQGIDLQFYSQNSSRIVAVYKFS